jgi:purine-binding chemotaxis protein CheW
MSSDQGNVGTKADGVAAAAEPLLAFADALLSEGQRQPTHTPDEIRQYVTFILRDEEYGIPILQCREIVRVLAVTRVPEAPDHVRGVVNLRGHIVPAVDTRRRFGFEPAPLTARSRLLVVEVAGRLFALIVDRVARVLKVPASDIEPPPEGATLPGATGLARVGEAVVHLMDANQMLRAGAAAAGTTTRGEEA